MRWINLIFPVLALYPGLSCEKAGMINNFPAEVSFDISGRMFEGQNIACIDVDHKGNVAVGSDKKLYYLNDGDHRSYNLDFEVLDLAIAPDESVWIGTRGGGLGHLSGNSFTWYTMENAGLPRDYVRNVLAAPDGKIWFSACAFRIGGLGVFDGKKFEFYTPENSPLNQNIIEDIEIGEDGGVFIATSGKVGRTNIYRISGNSWDCLGDEEGMFYWVFSFTLGPSGIIYLVEDFSLSSAMYPNRLFQFSDNEWNKIETEDMPRLNYFTTIKADRRNYCWIAGSEGESAFLHVFNGKSWINSPEDMLHDDFITTIEVDSDNNIWIGTYNNGVFILKQ
jgi:ligand-binding sensor domain-containing protein